MEIPYSTLMRIAWALWWRFYVVMLFFGIALVAPIVGFGVFYPIVWEALRASPLDRDLILLGFLPVSELLVGWPVAVGWFLRSRSNALGVAVRYRGNVDSIAGRKDRQVFLFAWSVSIIPVLWGLANGLLIHVLFPTASGGWQVWAAIGAIYGNVALLQLLAFVPMNLSWALATSPFGVEWRLLNQQETGK